MTPAIVASSTPADTSIEKQTKPNNSYYVRNNNNYFCRPAGMYNRVVFETAKPSVLLETQTYPPTSSVVKLGMETVAEPVPVANGVTS